MPKNRKPVLRRLDRNVPPIAWKVRLTLLLRRAQDEETKTKRSHEGIEILPRLHGRDREKESRSVYMKRNICAKGKRTNIRLLHPNQNLNLHRHGENPVVKRRETRKRGTDDRPRQKKKRGPRRKGGRGERVERRGTNGRGKRRKGGERKRKERSGGRTVGRKDWIPAE